MSSCFPSGRVTTATLLEGFTIEKAILFSLQKVQKYLKELRDHNKVNVNGDTLLHAYVRRKDKHRDECMLALLVYGQCSVDGANRQGFTPLHLAAEVCKFCAVLFLI